MRDDPKIPQRTVGVMGRSRDRRTVAVSLEGVGDSTKRWNVPANGVADANELVGRQVSRVHRASLQRRSTGFEALVSLVRRSNSSDGSNSRPRTRDATAGFESLQYRNVRIGKVESLRRRELEGLLNRRRCSGRLG
jgi:hypothetical protein